jgi:hydroxymethylbilane synthase
LAIVPIRGNVDTRLRKLDEGAVDALVMAAAGLKRIGRAERISEFLADEICVSAVAQGALGIEAREGDSVRERLGFLQHAPTCAEIAAERSMLDFLGGGCHVPIGARASLDGGELKIVGVVAAAGGERLCRARLTGPADQAEQLGRRLAEDLLRQGANELLADGGG